MLVKIEQDESNKHREVNSCAREGEAVHASIIVLLNVCIDSIQCSYLCLVFLDDLRKHRKYVMYLFCTDISDIDQIWMIVL